MSNENLDILEGEYKRLSELMNKLTSALLTASTLVALTVKAQDFTLVPLVNINEPTIVTVGIPFQKSALQDLSMLSVIDNEGSEVAISVLPTMYWHENGEKAGIRSVQVKFNVNNLYDEVTYSFDIDTKSKVSRISLGEESKVTVAGKSYHPKIINILPSSYLEQSGLIAPYSASNNVSNDFREEQLKWASELNYSKTTLANWLFDRVTALYKACMATEDAACYKEAYMSYNYWMDSLKRTGGVNDCFGGSLLDTARPIKACDTKYTYIEQIKLHTALTGDTSQHDTGFVKAMAELSRDQHYYQAKVDDPYDQESEPFTERAAGIILLAQINAYELTGDKDILIDIKNRIDVLYNHQQNNPDSLNPDGTWRHSWSKHEGSQYPGDGELDDKRFSPWMSENIIDALWQSKQILDDERIDIMLNKFTRALVDWGFTDSSGYVEKFGQPLTTLSGHTWHQGCNTTGDTILYSGSSVASAESLITTQNKEGYYSDNHLAEAIFMLSVGYIVDTDAGYKAEYKSRLDSVISGYLNAGCGKISSTKRLFNWNNRSNYWGTYLYAAKQYPELLQEAVEPVVNKGITNTFQNFTESYSLEWNNTDVFEIDEYGAYPVIKGFQYFKELTVGERYTINLSYRSESANTQNVGLYFGRTFNGFYTARVKAGPWGGIYLYKHSQDWDMAGKLVANHGMVTQYDKSHSLTVRVHGSQISLYSDDVKLIEHDAGVILEDGQIGLMSNATGGSMRLESISVISGENRNIISFDTKLEGLSETVWDGAAAFTVEDGSVKPAGSGRLIHTQYLNNGSYIIKNEMEISASEGSLVLGFLVGQSETHFYSLKLKGGQWGGVYIYKHGINELWDNSGQLIKGFPREVAFGVAHQAIVSVESNELSIRLDDELVDTLLLDEDIVAGNVGLISSRASNSISSKKLDVIYLEEF